MEIKILNAMFKVRETYTAPLILREKTNMTGKVVNKAQMTTISISGP